MTIKENLKSAGLTENEALVYQTLLELGSKTAGVVAKKTGLHRRVVYDVMDRLSQKGLIGYIVENGKKVFSASNPERFKEIIREKENEISLAMPSMIELFNSAKEKQKEDTLFFRGKEGLKSIFEDQLSEGKEIFIIGASPKAYEVFPFYWGWFDKARVEKKIKARILFDKPDEKRKISLSEIRYLPEKYSSNLAINIYGEKVAIILWSKEKPFAILIKNKEIAEGYKKQFEMMWKIARE